MVAYDKVIYIYKIYTKHSCCFGSPKTSPVKNLTPVSFKVRFNLLPQEPPAESLLPSVATDLDGWWAVRSQKIEGQEIYTNVGG